MKIKKIATPKIADRGVQCMFVGYAQDHAGDCYRMFHPKTSRVLTTHDVIWMYRMYYPKTETNQNVILEPSVVVTSQSDWILEAGESESEKDVSNEAETEEDYVSRYGRVSGPVARYMNKMTAFGMSESEAAYIGLILVACKK